MKLKSFWQAKDTQPDKAAAYSMENTFSNSTCDRGLISKIYKELKKLDIKFQIIQFKNGDEI